MKSSLPTPLQLKQSSSFEAKGTFLRPKFSTMRKPESPRPHKVLLQLTWLPCNRPIWTKPTRSAFKRWAKLLHSRPLNYKLWTSQTNCDPKSQLR
jgi:hypothetical protein